MALQADSSKCNKAIDHASNASIATLITYLICDFPHFISALSLIIDKAKYVLLVSHLKLLVYILQLIDASLNMILYCAMSTLFRSTLVDVIKIPIQSITSYFESFQYTESIEMSERSPPVRFQELIYRFLLSYSA